MFDCHLEGQGFEARLLCQFSLQRNHCRIVLDSIRACDEIDSVSKKDARISRINSPGQIPDLLVLMIYTSTFELRQSGLSLKPVYAVLMLFEHWERDYPGQTPVNGQ
jgi:hypothetical protein